MACQIPTAAFVLRINSSGVRRRNTSQGYWRALPPAIGETGEMVPNIRLGTIDSKAEHASAPFSHTLNPQRGPTVITILRVLDAVVA